MQQGVVELQNLLKNNNINIKNKNLQKIFSKFEITFYYNIIQIPKEIFNHEEDPKVIIIDEYAEKEVENKYFIICFDYKVIIFPRKNQDKADVTNLNDIFININDYKQYLIGKFKNCTEKEISDEDFDFLQEVQNFSKECTIKTENKNVNLIWKMIIDCLSGFIIKKG